MAINFDGIRERLKRANENIHNLKGEINRFLDTSEYPVLPQNDKELLLKAIHYHRKRPIPLRFSVLAGETIHHLRSCLDHVVWQFSRESYRTTHPTLIEFPVHEVIPVNKKRLTGYERKIKGVANPAALILIEMLQPYNASDPIDSALLVIHKMDIIDKHRDLVLCASTGAFKLPMDIMERYMRYKTGQPNVPPIDINAEFERHGKIVPQISLQQFGRREIEPVVQGLVALYNFVANVVAKFDAISDIETPFAAELEI